MLGQTRSSLLAINGDSFMGAANWLQLSADLKSVTLDPFSDGSEMFCETVAEFDDAKAKLHADFALCITRFTFSWTAFEILVEACKLEPHPSQIRSREPSKGKMGTWLLKKKAVNANDYKGYEHILEHAFECMARASSFEKVLIPHPKDNDYINEAGYGLEICRELRNKNLHGHLGVPIPFDWGEDRVPDRSELHFYNFALRLLLMSIQMVLACQIHSSLKLTEDDFLFEDSGPDLSKYLRVLQLAETKPHSPHWFQAF